MNLPRSFSAREYRLAIITGFIVLVWVFIGLIVGPLWNKAQVLRLNVQTQTDRVDALRLILKRANMIKSDFAQFSGFLTDAGVEEVRGQLLTDLESLSRQSNVRLDLKPIPSRNIDRSQRIEIEVNIEGAQNNLLGFIDGLMRMPRLITVARLRIATIPGKEKELRATIVIHHLLVENVAASI